MQYVELLGSCDTGGTCARCGEDKHADNRVRILGEYTEDGRSLVEPFNICRTCYREIRSK